MSIYPSITVHTYPVFQAYYQQKTSCIWQKLSQKKAMLYVFSTGSYPTLTYIRGKPSLHRGQAK